MAKTSKFRGYARKDASSRFSAREVRSSSSANMIMLGEALNSWRNANGAGAKIAQLDQLWRNWDMVMGRFLSPIAHPLGHREHILVIGADDNFIMQELTYAVPEILERANAFMGGEEFIKVDLQMLQGKTPLNKIRTADYPALPKPPKPEQLGGLMGLMNPSSPVARSYAAYVRLFEELDPE